MFPYFLPSSTKYLQSLLNSCPETLIIIHQRIRHFIKSERNKSALNNSTEIIYVIILNTILYHYTPCSVVSSMNTSDTTLPKSSSLHPNNVSRRHINALISCYVSSTRTCGGVILCRVVVLGDFTGDARASGYYPKALLSH